MDSPAACGAALAWMHSALGPAVVVEVERACLMMSGDGDDGGGAGDYWSLRARRKLAILLVVAMSPVRASVRELCGGRFSGEEAAVGLLGVPREWWASTLRPEQRPRAWSVRTIARDLEQIAQHSALLMRWRVPAEKAQSWERGRSGRTITRYVLRVQRAGARALEAVEEGARLVKAITLNAAARAWLAEPPPLRVRRARAPG